MEEMGVVSENKIKPPIVLTHEEWLKHNTKLIMESGPDHPEFASWLAEKGIVINSGLVSVIIDGRESYMNTDWEDFGTVLMDEALTKYREELKKGKG